jgi:hypothetical protein
MPATNLADLFSFSKHILAAYQQLLTAANFNVLAQSNDESSWPCVRIKYDAGEVPRRYITPTAGPLAGKRLEDHRPGQLTFELCTARTDDDHDALTGELLAVLQDPDDEIPDLLPYYAVVEARILGAPITTQDDRETVTTISWQFDVFILPGAVPDSPTAIGYYTNRDLTDRLAASGGTSTALLSTINHGTSTYVRNAALWVGADNVPELTGIPVYTGPTARSRGILITSQHLLVAAHYPPLVNAPVRFVDADGEVVERTVTEIRTVSGTNVAVAVLDIAVTPEVTFYSMATSSLLYQAAFGCVVDAESKVLSTNITPNTAFFFSHSRVTSGPLAAVSEALITGDSGSPFFLILNGQVVILGTALAVTTSPLASGHFAELVAICAPENKTPELYDGSDFII